MRKFRNTASFGKRIEYTVIAEMLKEGLDVFLPIVDDMGIDAIIRKNDGSFIEIQIKARSDKVKFGDAALFTVNKHEKERKNYFFVFYSQRLEAKWIMSSKEFVKISRLIKNGKSKGSRQLWMSGRKKKKEYIKPDFQKYVVNDYDKFK